LPRPGGRSSAAFRSTNTVGHHEDCTFGAPSRGSRPRCLRFVVRSPVSTQDSLAARWLAFGRAGLPPAGFHPRVSRVSSGHPFPSGQACLAHSSPTSPTRKSCTVSSPTCVSRPTSRLPPRRGACPASRMFSLTRRWAASSPGESTRSRTIRAHVLPPDAASRMNTPSSLEVPLSPRRLGPRLRCERGEPPRGLDNHPPMPPINGAPGPIRPRPPVPAHPLQFRKHLCRPVQPRGYSTGPVRSALFALPAPRFAGHRPGPAVPARGPVAASR